MSKNLNAIESAALLNGGHELLNEVVLVGVIGEVKLEEAGVRHIAYPGDPKHSRSERAFIGPTRLQFKNGRFEPAGGLDVLLNP